MVNAIVWLVATAHNSPDGFSCALLTTDFPSTAPLPQACLARRSFVRQGRVVARYVPGRVPPCRSMPVALAGGWPFARIYGHSRTAV